MRALRLLLVCGALTGCATMDESACRSAKWDELGYADGVTGGPPRIDQYAYQCSQYNVAPDEKTYVERWRDGNGEYGRRVPGPSSGM